MRYASQNAVATINTPLSSFVFFSPYGSEFLHANLYRPKNSKIGGPPPQKEKKDQTRTLNFVGSTKFVVGQKSWDKELLEQKNCRTWNRVRAIWESDDLWRM